jgi:GTPase SAR1 family protein
MEDDYYYYIFKIIIIGSMSTGKTSIVTRYIRDEFYEPQRATWFEFMSKIVKVRNQNIKVTV